jgi:hypothetical protein
MVAFFDRHMNRSSMATRNDRDGYADARLFAMESSSA